MSAGLTAVVVYVVGFLAALVVFGRQFEKQFGALDYDDVGAVLFFSFGWPILLPFAALTWAAKTLLPLLGVEVRR